MENEPVLLSGITILERLVFREDKLFAQTGQRISTTWRRGKKKTFLPEHLPVAGSRYCVYFLLELKRVDMGLKRK